MATLEEMNEYRKKREKVEGYKQVLAALTAVDQVRHAIHMARDAFLITIPTDATVYAARISCWLREQKDMLEHDLGLAETLDQYGQPLGEMPGEDE